VHFNISDFQLLTLFCDAAAAATDYIVISHVMIIDIKSRFFKEN